MKKRWMVFGLILIISMVAVLAWPPASGALKLPWKKGKEKAPERENPGFLDKISGKVAVLQGGTDVWVGATQEMKVFKGDQVRTLENSRVKIKLPDDHELHLGENSLLTLTEIVKDKKENRHITLTDLTRGAVWAKVTEPGSIMDKLRGKDTLMEFQFKVTAANVSAFPLGTMFTMLLQEDKSVLIASCKGDLEISAPGGGLLIPAKHFSTVSGNNPPEPIRTAEYIEERKDDPAYQFCFTCHTETFKTRDEDKNFKE